jgi:alkaline phosphatase D
MRIPITVAALLFSLTSISEAYHPIDFEAPLEVIAFGSCNRQNLAQPLWPVISENSPDLWIWGGDNIYGDSKDAEVIAERYAVQVEQPAYAAFRARFPIVGTWDDHDYGWNNAGKDYPLKAVTQNMALDFMQVPAKDPRRQREGIYGAYDFGPAGKRVKVILLDGRYFATGKKAEQPELIGEAQKAWLANELKESTAQVHLLVSGIQVISEEHNWESWAEYPADREWLLNLIATTQTPGVIFISGDRHIHELSKLKDPRISYPLIDATSSGLTHSWENFKGEPNKHRIGEVHKQLGFGLLRIDWHSPVSVGVQIEIRDETNEVVNKVALELPLK